MTDDLQKRIQDALANPQNMGELAEVRQQDANVRLLDVRSREEFEAVHIEGSVLMSQDSMRAIMADGSNTQPLVIVDHQGKSALDAAAYFMGHGLQNIRCLRGGIDAWAQEVEPAMRRYKLGSTAPSTNIQAPEKFQEPGSKYVCHLFDV